MSQYDKAAKKAKRHGTWRGTHRAQRKHRRSVIRYRRRALRRAGKALIEEASPSYPEHAHFPILTDDESVSLCRICGALLAVHADTRISRHWRDKRGEPIGEAVGDGRGR